MSTDRIKRNQTAISHNVSSLRSRLHTKSIARVTFQRPLDCSLSNYKFEPCPLQCSCPNTFDLSVAGSIASRHYLLIFDILAPRHSQRASKTKAKRRYPTERVMVTIGTNTHLGIQMTIHHCYIPRRIQTQNISMTQKLIKTFPRVLTN